MNKIYLALTLLLSVSSLRAATYYVAPGGSDGNPGSLASPYLTIQKAATVALPGDTVQIRAGTYRETVTPTNSGTAGSPITYRNYNNETVTISGADPITGVTWAQEGTTSIYRATLPASGPGAMTLNNQNQILVNGRPLVLARWPNVSADLSIVRPNLSRITGMVNMGSTVSNQWTLEVTDPNLPNINWTGALMGIQCHVTAPWGTAKVTAFDNATKKLTIQIRPPHTAVGNLPFFEDQIGSGKNGSKFWLSGISAALDAPGEWFYNPSTRELRVWLPTSDSPANHTIEVRANRQWAFDLTQKNYITLQGLKFLATSVTTETFPNGSELNTQATAQSIFFNPASPRSRNVILDGLSFASVFHADSVDTNGGTFDPEDPYSTLSVKAGVVVAGLNHIMRNCLVEGSAANGIVVLGEGHLISNNVIHNVALLALEHSGIYMGDTWHYSKNIEVKNNSIYDTANYFIRFYAARGCTIHHNDCWGGKTMVTDGGGIYSWGSDGRGDTPWRTEVAYNRVHDGYVDGYGSMGIYLDSFSKNYIIHHNVVWNQDIGIAINDPDHENIDYVHNTCSEGIAGDSSMLCATLNNNGSSYTNQDINPNVTGTQQNNSVRSNLITGYLVQDYDANSDDPILDKNLIGKTRSIYLPAQNASTGFVVSTDPLFTNRAGLDFTLQAGSPAVDAGSTTQVAVRVKADGSVLANPAVDSYVGSAPDIGAFERGATGVNAWGLVGSSLITSQNLLSNPTQLSAVITSPTVVALSWTAPSSANGSQVVERKIGAFFVEIGRVSATATAFTETGLRPGTRSYRLRTVNGGMSNIVTVTTGRDASAINPTDYQFKHDPDGGIQTDLANSIVSGSNAGDYLRYDNVAFGDAGTYTTVTFNYKRDGTTTAELWIDGLSTATGGTRLATVSLTGTSWGTGVTTSVNLLTSVSGTRIVYLTLSGAVNLLNPIAFNVVAAPATPTALLATANSGSSITVNWADNASNELHYRVERSSNSFDFEQVADLAANATSYVSGGLSPSTTYYFRVRAVNAGGTSSVSNVASATTLTSTTVATPTFSPVAGTYSSTQSVTISTATSDATLRYTTDGSTPTSTTGTIYSGAITVASTTTLKAIAYKSGLTNSAVVTAAYTITPPSAQWIYQPFADASGTASTAMALVSGVTSHSGTGTVQSTSALTYTNVASSGNGLTTANGSRFFMSLNTALPSLAPYVSGGMIGGTGTGVLYVSWLARGILPNSSTTFDFRTGNGTALPTVDETTVSVGTTSANNFIRAMSANALNSGWQNYSNSTVAPTVNADLYVAKFTFGAGNTSRVDIYVNQTTEGTPTVTTTGFAQFNTLSFANFGTAAAPLIDEIRMAGTYAAVVPASGASPTGVQTFRTTYSLAANGSQDSLTPAGDGVQNLLKYAFNMVGTGTGQAAAIANPNASILTANGSAGLPLVGVGTGLDVGKLQITYIRRKSTSNPGVGYAVEFSDTLANGTWAVNASATTVVTSIDATFERVVVTDNAASANRRFVRTRVTVL